MWVEVRLRYEDGGRPIAKWRDALPPKVVYGELSQGLESYRPLNDTMPVARLRMPGPVPDVLPPLLRASTLRIKNGEIHITGQEHEELFNKFTVQTWTVRVLAPRCPTKEEAVDQCIALARSVSIGRQELLDMIAARMQRDAVA